MRNKLVTMPKELKPCPFCGGRAIVYKDGSRYSSHVVGCEDRGCRLENGEEGEFKGKNPYPKGYGTRHQYDHQKQKDDPSNSEFSSTNGGRELQQQIYLEHLR